MDISSCIKVAEKRGIHETELRLWEFLRFTRDDMEEFVRRSLTEEYKDEENYAWFSDAQLLQLPLPLPLSSSSPRKPKKPKKKLNRK